MKTKITFSRASVILMYLAVIGYVAAGYITGDWPPDAITYGWFGFWLGQGIITCSLTVNKRTNNRKVSLAEAITPFINHENAVALAEKCLDIDVKYKTPQESVITEKVKSTAKKSNATKKSNAKSNLAKKTSANKKKEEEVVCE